MLTLRGYNVFIGWYVAALMHGLPDEEHTLWIDFEVKIFNEIQDWYRELETRYEEGIVYKHDNKRRAGGLPLEIPNVPPIIQRHRIEVIQYPIGHGYGARLDHAVMQELLQSISAKHPDVFDIWRRATEQVSPVPTAVASPLSTCKVLSVSEP